MRIHLQLASQPQLLPMTWIDDQPAWTVEPERQGISIGDSEVARTDGQQFHWLVFSNRIRRTLTCSQGEQAIAIRP